MGTAATIFSHAMTAGQALNGTAATPMAGTTNGTSGTSGSDETGGDSATISANDFLTLLVTEMQNQDPTADTDPNEYINQLVQVNSLEQLIGINQTLTGALGTPTSATGDGSSSQVAHLSNGSAETSAVTASAHASHAGSVTASPSTAPASAVTAAHNISSAGAAGHVAPGNLGMPDANAAAQRVGHALNGTGHLKPSKGNAIALQ
ncbi:MAG TPA: flagellar hook capping FlgD N-terminal domain-containing protein [Terracidiphilus sp.]|jgi:flagellar basal-body rod modification protein FlgD